MKCTTCGNQVSDATAFCGQCGSPVDSASVPPSTATRAFSPRGGLGQTNVMPRASSCAPQLAHKYKADIVPVFDCTASMTPSIEGLKSTVVGFSRDLEDNNIDCALGLVEYRDFKIGEKTVVHGFASSPEKFRKWVGRLRASGGGDEPESAIDALYSAMSMPFRTGATRIITLITDASYHEPGENGKTMEDVIAAMRTNKIIVYVIGPDLPGYRRLADCMGGILFNISGDPAEFRRIVKSLGQSISETVPRMSDLRSAADKAFSHTRTW